MIFEGQNTAKSRKFAELRNTILANVKDLDYDVQDLDESINIVKYFLIFHMKCLINLVQLFPFSTFQIFSNALKFGMF